MTLPAIWSRTDPLGHPASTTAFGSVAAPLFAGFALVAVVELVGRPSRGTRGDLAVLAFTAAAALLVFAIQAALTAARFQVSPAERLAWVPESRTDDAWMSWLRAGQWQDDRVAERHRALFRWTYNAGIVAFLLGLLAALLPEPGGWTWPRVLALCVSAAAVAVEVVLTVQRPGALRRLLSPTSEDLREHDAKTEASRPVPIDGRQLRVLVYENGDMLAADIDRLDDRLDMMSGELSAIALRLDQPGARVPPAPPDTA